MYVYIDVNHMHTQAFDYKSIIYYHVSLDDIKQGEESALWNKAMNVLNVGFGHHLTAK